MRQVRDRFVKTPGLTKLACHQIDTVGSPARVPSRRILAHFQQEVQEQMNEMLKKENIACGKQQLVASSCSLHQEEDRRNPIVCGLTRGKQLCVDYREVNNCVWTTAR